MEDGRGLGSWLEAWEGARLARKEGLPRAAQILQKDPKTHADCSQHRPAHYRTTVRKPQREKSTTLTESQCYAYPLDAMPTDSSRHSGAYPSLLDESEKDQIHKVCRIYWPESQEYADDAEPHVKRRESGLACAIIVLRALLCQLPPTGREKLVLQPGVNPVLEAALLLDSDESMRLARMAAGSGPIGFRSIMESTEMLR